MTKPFLYLSGGTTSQMCGGSTNDGSCYRQTIIAVGQWYISNWSMLQSVATLKGKREGFHGSNGPEVVGPGWPRGLSR
jgi:hypothetical protein